MWEVCWKNSSRNWILEVDAEGDVWSREQKAPAVLTHRPLIDTTRSLELEWYFLSAAAWRHRSEFASMQALVDHYQRRWTLTGSKSSSGVFLMFWLVRLSRTACDVLLIRFPLLLLDTQLAVITAETRWLHSLDLCHQLDDYTLLLNHVWS